MKTHDLGPERTQARMWPFPVQHRRTATKTLTCTPSAATARNAHNDACPPPLLNSCVQPLSAGDARALTATGHLHGGKRPQRGTSPGAALPGAPPGFIPNPILPTPGNGHALALLQPVPAAGAQRHAVGGGDERDEAPDDGDVLEEVQQVVLVGGAV